MMICFSSSRWETHANLHFIHIFFPPIIITVWQAKLFMATPFFSWYSEMLNVLHVVKRLKMLFFFSSFRSNQPPSHWAFTIGNPYTELYHISCVGKMHALFLSFWKQSSICHLNPQVVSFQTVRYKISKWNICSSLLFYNHINWQMSLGNREKHISHYVYFEGVMLMTTGYHTPKIPSQQETKLQWTQSVANLLPLHIPPEVGPMAHRQQEAGCPVMFHCGEPYPQCCQVWFFNYHVVCTKALCQFNYCLINGVLQVYFRGLSIY